MKKLFVVIFLSCLTPSSFSAQPIPEATIDEVEHRIERADYFTDGDSTIFRKCGSYFLSALSTSGMVVVFKTEDFLIVKGLSVEPSTMWGSFVLKKISVLIEDSRFPPTAEFRGSGDERRATIRISHNEFQRSWCLDDRPPPRQRFTFGEPVAAR